MMMIPIDVPVPDVRWLRTVALDTSKWLGHGDGGIVGYWMHQTEMNQDLESDLFGVSVARP